MLSFPAGSQTGNPSIQVLSLPPTSSYVREGTGHMVPRSRSSLKGSWECSRKHLLQLCQLESLLSKRLESGEGRVGHRRMGRRREADVTRYHKTNRNGQIVHFKYVPLNVLQLYLNKLKKRKEERAGPSPTTSKVHCCPTALGKRVLMRKFN